MNTKPLPKDLTSYDLLKAFAVLIMIIDHMGSYFFPEELWWRAIGRIGFPVWFFLIGYARGRDIPLKLAAGAGILLAGNLVVGQSLFPLNALCTIAIIRVILDHVMTVSLRHEANLWGLSIVLLLLMLPSYFFTEYGTQALITAIFGYLVRHRREISNDGLVIRYMIFALVTFVLFQQVVFGFSQEQFLFMAIGTAAVRAVLFYFEARTYPDLTKKTWGPVTYIMQLCGRRTLEIYVVHLILFKILAASLGMEGFGWLDFRVMPPGSNELIALFL